MSALAVNITCWALLDGSGSNSTEHWKASSKVKPILSTSGCALLLQTSSKPAKPSDQERGVGSDASYGRMMQLQASHAWRSSIKMLVVPHDNKYAQKAAVKGGCGKGRVQTCWSWCTSSDRASGVLTGKSGICKKGRWPPDEMVELIKTGYYTLLCGLARSDLRTTC
jgi:hypothetical protein